MSQILHDLTAKKAQQQKQLAVLIDPDKRYSEADLAPLCTLATEAGVDFFLVGGSLISRPDLDTCLRYLKQNTTIPVIIFPGSPLQISGEADAILFLSLISGRNPEALIGHHVVAAPYIKKAGLEPLPTGYMLVDCGETTTAQYMSNTPAMPWHKPEIAAVTAMAGEMLGLRLMYLDGGSGAAKTVSEEMVKAVSERIECPLIVGGGIRTPQDARKLTEAGADIIVIGNATEKDPSLISAIAKAVHA